jgi:hypothetical protein
MALAYYILENGALRREGLFRDRSNPFDVNTDEQFRQRYRLSKESALRLNELLADQLQSPDL